MTRNILLDIKGLTKVFPGVKALDNVDLTVKKGEIHVLVGENGAGKSTLVNILSGGILPTEVEKIYFDGKEYTSIYPKDAMEAGIATIHQHFSLVPEMTVKENIFLGREKDQESMVKKTKELLGMMGLCIHHNTLIKYLSVSERQMVEICKALLGKPKLLIMDEPTASLGLTETKKLFDIVNKLKKEGTTILYISHYLEEMFEIGETVTVLRNGKKIVENELKELDHKKLTALIVGKEETINKADLAVDIKNITDNIVLNVKNLENKETKVTIKDISFELKEGEIIGIYGIVGAGKSELSNTLFGVNNATGGYVEAFGERQNIRNPMDAIKLGISFITKDRRRYGIIKVMNVRSNISLVALNKFLKFKHYILDYQEKEAVRDSIDMLNIICPSGEASIEHLSGGNQQKALIARWLLLEESKIMLLNEVTKGVDVGSRREILRIVKNEAKRGKGIIYLSSEIEEILNVANRIFVMVDGSFVKEFNSDQLMNSEVSKDELLFYGTGKRTNCNQATSV